MSIGRQERKKRLYRTQRPGDRRRKSEGARALKSLLRLARDGPQVTMNTTKRNSNLLLLLRAPSDRGGLLWTVQMGVTRSKMPRSSRKINRHPTKRVVAIKAQPTLKIQGRVQCLLSELFPVVSSLVFNFVMVIYDAIIQRACLRIWRHCSR